MPIPEEVLAGFKKINLASGKKYNVDSVLRTLNDLFFTYVQSDRNSEEDKEDKEDIEKLFYSLLWPWLEYCDKQNNSNNQDAELTHWYGRYFRYEGNYISALNEFAYERFLRGIDLLDKRDPLNRSIGGLTIRIYSTIPAAPPFNHNQFINYIGKLMLDGRYFYAISALILHRQRMGWGTLQAIANEFSLAKNHQVWME